MATFAPAITDYWNVPPLRGDVVVDAPGFTVVIDPTLAENRRVVQFIDSKGTHRFVLRPDAAQAAGIGADTPGIDALLAALAAAGELFHDWDHVFYLEEGSRAALFVEPVPVTIRHLSDADAAAFRAFQATNTAEELDEAFVELDHAPLMGVVEPDGEGGERIVCVASAYGWDGTTLSDVGILTSPPARGRGLARQLVRAISRELLAAGSEPQYRCGVENAASRATAESAGFTRFGTWRVVNGEAPEQEGPPVL